MIVWMAEKNEYKRKLPIRFKILNQQINGFFIIAKKEEDLRKQFGRCQVYLKLSDHMLLMVSKF
jgi:hypothetical protein